MSSVPNTNKQGQLRFSKAKDRRAFGRYPVSTSFRYRVFTAAQTRMWKQGACLNMSAGGLLVELPEQFPRGCTLEINMNWPGLYHGKAVVCLSLKVRVLRAENGHTALRIISSQFSDVSPSDGRAQAFGNARAVA
jgi:c-di-GMP-binding flagellar brake protein YcgR